MIKHSLFSNLLLAATAACALAVLIAPATAAHRATPTGTHPPTTPTAPAGEIVAYESLEQHVGAQLAIETTLNTVRRGTLVKYTNPTLTLQLGAEHGSIDLSIPRDTVRSIRLLSMPAAQPKAAPQEAEGHRAEKN